MRCFQPIAAYVEIGEMPTRDGKRVKILPKSLLEGTRCLVKIFEGFWGFGQMSEWCFSGDFGRSVQYVLAFLDRCICHAVSLRNARQMELKYSCQEIKCTAASFKMHGK